MSILEFDSEWFGVRIGRYDDDPIEADRWAKDNSVGCVYCLLPIEKIDMVFGAVQRGFRLTDVRVEFVARTSLLIPFSPRLLEPEDMPALKEIAASSFVKTRFHNDRRFDTKRVNEMYANWVETASGRILVQKVDDVPVGFVLVGDTHLELIAVADGYREHGFGVDLAKGAIGIAHGLGKRELRVVTQGGNHAAQRTFQAAGFELERTSLWLHKWYQ